MMKSVPASQQDLLWISEVLQKEQLCYADIQNENVKLWKLEKDGSTIGFFGFEVCNKDALLRSVVVSEEERSSGLGRKLVNEAFARARDLKIHNLYLLTFSAEGFFGKLGFTTINRKSVPPPIANTEEFKNFCPDTATCMKKEINHG